MSEKKEFTIAVASGKGGTGKTTIAVALALALAEEGEQVTLLDTDVEAPNAHLFLGVDLAFEKEARSSVPEVDMDACTACGICRDVCEYNAIAILAEKPLVFAELCHACGSCMLHCPEKAITEVPKTIGWIEKAQKDNLAFRRGKLKVGEVQSVSVIEAVRAMKAASGWTIIDAPPGSSCPVIAAVNDVDYLMLVTEPTPFGLNDLELAVELSRALKLPCGVIVNRADMGTKQVHDYCKAEGVPILLEIPFDRRFAEVYSKGGTLKEALPEMAAQLCNIAHDIRKEAAQ